MVTRTAIGLGSNLGSREKHLEKGRRGLERLGTIVSMSSWYETAPVGGPQQGPYLNAVIVLDTALAPRALLEGMLEIERRSGRVRRERWGPRILDLDLLLYGNQVVDEPGLTVPHPELLRRRFALEPLLEAWPEATLPDGTRLWPILDSVRDQDVEPFDPMAEVTFPPWAPFAVFITVGLGAVALWWLLGALL